MQISPQRSHVTPETAIKPAKGHEAPAVSGSERVSSARPSSETLELTAGSAKVPQVPLVTESPVEVKPAAVTPVEKPRPPARPARVSAYGPGLYGNRTANGTRLTPNTIGVAHKTLPLGTRLEVTVNGQTVPARVIDRGPYERGRDFDLTMGLIQKLGFPNCAIFGVRQVLIRIFR